MSFNKIYLDKISVLKEEYKQDPKAFKLRMRKADVLIGETDSLKFVNKKIK